MGTYYFEGGNIDTDLPEHILDHLAGIVISYKVLSRDRVTKAAKEQRAFFNGVLCGLELTGRISCDEREKLYHFFMDE